MAYASFEDYRLLYGGVLINFEHDFAPVAERASDYMDAVTFGRLQSSEYEYGFVERQIKKCCCALAENLYRYDNRSQGASDGGKQSETIGKYSVTYSSPLDALGTLTGSTFADYQHRTALMYLGRTGLMYRGGE